METIIANLVLTIIHGSVLMVGLSCFGIEWSLVHWLGACAVATVVTPGADV